MTATCVHGLQRAHTTHKLETFAVFHRPIPELTLDVASRNEQTALRTQRQTVGRTCRYSLELLNAFHLGETVLLGGRTCPELTRRRVARDPQSAILR